MLTKHDGVQLRDRLINEGDMSRQTIAKLMGFLQAAFECSVQDSKLEKNPFKGIFVEVDEKSKLAKSRMTSAWIALMTAVACASFDRVEPGLPPPRQAF